MKGGVLTLPPSTNHTDHVNAVAVVVPPAPDGNGNPTGKPLLGAGGQPKQAINPATGKPVTVTDADAFHASSPAPAAVPPPPVIPPAPPLATSPLAYTGADIAGMLEYAGAFLIVGLLVVLSTRRRRRT